MNETMVANAIKEKLTRGDDGGKCNKREKLTRGDGLSKEKIV
jgi:hypothetical protein